MVGINAFSPWIPLLLQKTLNHINALLFAFSCLFYFSHFQPAINSNRLRHRYSNDNLSNILLSSYLECLASKILYQKFPIIRHNIFWRMGQSLLISIKTQIFSMQPSLPRSKKPFHSAGHKTQQHILSPTTTYFKFLLKTCM